MLSFGSLDFYGCFSYFFFFQQIVCGWLLGRFTTYTRKKYVVDLGFKSCTCRHLGLYGILYHMPPLALNKGACTFMNLCILVC